MKMPVYRNTVKHDYSDHPYNEMKFITKRLGIPGKHSIFFPYKFYANSEVGYNEITLKTKLFQSSWVFKIIHFDMFIAN